MAVALEQREKARVEQEKERQEEERLERIEKRRQEQVLRAAGAGEPLNAENATSDDSADPKSKRRSSFAGLTLVSR